MYNRMQSHIYKPYLSLSLSLSLSLPPSLSLSLTHIHIRTRSHIGTFGAAYVALSGDISSTVQSLAATNSIILFPFKFAVSYTILYHWMGAMRHFAWDHQKFGNQVTSCALLHPPVVFTGLCKAPWCVL